MARCSTTRCTARQRDGQPGRPRPLEPADCRGRRRRRRLRGARHISAEQTPLANLHLTLLDKVGVQLEKFVDSTGKVAEILEPLNV